MSQPRKKGRKAKLSGIASFTAAERAIVRNVADEFKSAGGMSQVRLPPPPGPQISVITSAEPIEEGPGRVAITAPPLKIIPRAKKPAAFVPAPPPPATTKARTTRIFSTEIRRIEKRPAAPSVDLTEDEPAPKRRAPPTVDLTRTNGNGNGNGSRRRQVPTAGTAPAFKLLPGVRQKMRGK